MVTHGKCAYDERKIKINEPAAAARRSYSVIVTLGSVLPIFLSQREASSFML